MRTRNSRKADISEDGRIGCTRPGITKHSTPICLACVVSHPSSPHANNKEWRAWRPPNNAATWLWAPPISPRVMTIRQRMEASPCRTLDGTSSDAWNYGPSHLLNPQSCHRCLRTRDPLRTATYPVIGEPDTIRRGHDRICQHQAQAPEEPPRPP